MNFILTSDFRLLFEGIINIITSVGTVSYIAIMNFSENKNTSHKRLILTMSLITLLCFLRGTVFLLEYDFESYIEKSVLIVSSLIPLSLFLQIELLLRRHFPKILKIYIILSTLFVLGGFFIHGVDKTTVLTLMFSYIIAMSIFAYVLLTRKRSELTPDENKILDSASFVAVAIIPLIVTDFRTMINIDVIRLGAFGILFFIYSLVNIWDRESSSESFAFLIFLIIFNIITANLICFIFNLNGMAGYMFVIITMLRMLISIVTRAKESYTSRSKQLISTIVEKLSAERQSLLELKEDCRTNDFLVVTKEDLIHYRSKNIESFFEKSGIFFKNELAEKAIMQKTDKDTMDEIFHLYEDFDCNACCFIKYGDHFLLILLKWPPLAPKTELAKEIAIIKNICSMNKWLAS